MRRGTAEYARRFASTKWGIFVVDQGLDEPTRPLKWRESRGQ
jgi:hypothetical protein